MLPLPNFVIIGAQKCATVWLAYNLERHDDVYVAPSEAMFFNYSARFHTLGVEWYRQQFDGWRGERFVGESTPGYLMLCHRPERVAKRIRSTLPGVRLLAILRNPVDRAQSAMVHNIRRRRLPRDCRLIELVHNEPELVERHNLIDGGRYAQSLDPYLRLLGDQLLVLLLDDVENDPAAVYGQALRHIGIDDGFVPTDLDAVRHSNQRHGADGPAEGSVRGGFGRAKRALLRQPLKAGDLSIPPLAPADRAELYHYFEDDVRVLEGMLDRDLSAWKPG